MPKRHGDDWKAMWTKVANRDAFLWPSINAEDLAQEDTAMLLLDSRANSLPSAFAQSDLESARMGIITGAIARRKYPYLRQYTMAIEELEENNKEPIESRYGRIYSRKQLDAVRETAIEEGKLRKMDFIDHLWTSQPGLLLLEIQAGIMEFLQKFTILILEELDISHALETARLLEVQPSPLIGLASDTTSTNLSNIIAQAPYRVPDLMDFKRLVKVVQDKVMIAEGKSCYTSCAQSYMVIQLTNPQNTYGIYMKTQDTLREYSPRMKSAKKRPPVELLHRQRNLAPNRRLLRLQQKWTPRWKVPNAINCSVI
jgi:hypothetical protein